MEIVVAADVATQRPDQMAHNVRRGGQDGSAHHLAADRAHVVWTTSPGLHVDGETYPECTFIYSPRGEDASLSGVGGVQAYLEEFPRLD